MTLTHNAVKAYLLIDPDSDIYWLYNAKTKTKEFILMGIPLEKLADGDRVTISNAVDQAVREMSKESLEALFLAGNFDQLIKLITDHIHEVIDQPSSGLSLFPFCGYRLKMATESSSAGFSLEKMKEIIRASIAKLTAAEAPSPSS